MKYLVKFAILFMPVLVCAENYGGIDQQQMQVMMQKAQEMQICINNVDRAEMEELQKKGKQLEVEIKALCTSGQRSEAQSKTIAFIEEFKNSSSMKEIQKCGEMVKEMMESFSKITKSSEDGDSDGHICDNLN